MKTLEFKFNRTIPAPAEEVYKAWLDPKVPGTIWQHAEKLILNPEIDGLFYLLVHETAHYGRFTELVPPRRIQYTFVSPNTLGEESTVTASFEKSGDSTLMTLIHSGLPDDDRAREHEEGWNYFLDKFKERLSNAC